MKKYLFLLITLWCAQLFADPASDLSSLMNSIRTVKANFTQNILDNNGKTVQSSSGNMSLSRPGKFRWEVKQPMQQLIVANAGKIWIYDPDLEQVTVRNLKQATGDSPAALLTNVTPVLTNDYTISSNTKNNLQWFKLIPKSKDAAFEVVQIGFANNQLQAMNLQDNLGHTTKITFSNVQTNTTLSDSLFNFKPPKNADVLDETNKG